MNLHHLRYFETLATVQHYTKASKLLNITQPSLSNAISLLEAELGVRLFEKDGRNIILTKQGKVFQGYVEKSLNTLDTGIDTLEKISSGFGRIELSFLQILGTSFVPEIVRGYLAANSDKEIDFGFHSGVTSEIITGIKEREYDIGFCSYMQEEDDLDFFPIASQELVLIVPLDHPLAQQKTVDLRDTIDYPYIAFSQSSGLRAIVDDLFKKINQNYQIQFEVEEDQVIAGFVSQGFGISIVPNMPLLDSLPLKKIELVNLSWERIFYLAIPKNIYLPPVVYHFKQYVLQNTDYKHLI
ncbi:LysR family transcriptional regulator [Vagococcus sp. BWB3-3]|uniref:LysR family transcriptional regulator n=1 Tax=Vagococcus allomyrinae TaxID=2794353 RepID=A0A940P5F9_9ENTE|nr:LysR family transcriptional regulator [Vagococcus allomyrinae]MBP1041752.1 LysR family transcriptional regulator [Vagococcus allomyrinae]